MATIGQWLSGSGDLAGQGPEHGFTNGHKEFLGGDQHAYLDRGDGFVGGYMGQNIKLGT